MTFKEHTDRAFDRFSGTISDPAFSGRFVKRMLADWKAERGKLIGALEEIEEMGGMTLLGDRDFPDEDKAHQVGANKAFGQAAMVARAVLAEVKEKR